MYSITSDNVAWIARYMSVLNSMSPRGRKRGRVVIRLLLFVYNLVYLEE